MEMLKKLLRVRGDYCSSRGCFESVCPVTVNIRLPASLYVKGTTIPVGREGDHSTCRKLKQSDLLSLVPIEPSYMYRCNSGEQ